MVHSSVHLCGHDMINDLFTGLYKKIFIVMQLRRA